MGTQKLLLPLHGRTVIAQVVDAILAAGIGQVFVVVGQDGAQIAEALTGRAVRFVTNADPGGDMLSSVRCGWRALPAECEAVLVALGDQPTVGAPVIQQLLAAFTGSASGIAVPVHGERRGHPLLIAARYGKEILTQHDGVGLRGLLQAHPEDLREISVPTASVLTDLDTPDDYRRALGH